MRHVLQLCRKSDMIQIDSKTNERCKLTKANWQISSTRFLAPNVGIVKWQMCAFSYEFLAFSFFRSNDLINHIINFHVLEFFAKKKIAKESAEVTECITYISTSSWNMMIMFRPRQKVGGCILFQWLSRTYRFRKRTLRCADEISMKNHLLPRCCLNHKTPLWINEV